MTGRTRQCSEAVRAGRLKKATEFHDAAVLIEDQAPNAAVDLLVQAGIAAADAICCARLGVYSAGESHAEAIALLDKAERDMARHLRTLLSLKSKVAYSHQSVTTSDRKKAGRAALNLVEAARRITQLASGRDG